MTSRGVEGVTTVSPGTDAYQPSNDWEWVAPTEAPAPVTVRMIKGIENWPPGHIPDLGGVVDDLVHGEEAEVDGHQFDDGPQAGHGRAHAGSDDDRFGQWGVLDALLAVLLPETLGDGETRRRRVRCPLP